MHTNCAHTKICSVCYLQAFASQPAVLHMLSGSRPVDLKETSINQQRSQQSSSNDYECYRLISCQIK